MAVSKQVRRGAGLVLLWVVVAIVIWSRRPSVTYDTIEVKKEDIHATVNAIGTLQPHQYVDVGAQVSGQILKLLVQPGDIVEQGQLLVEIDPSVQQAVVDAGRAAIAGLQAQLAEQRAQHKLAGLKHARQQRMARDGATRDEDVQSAEAELASAAARIARLQAQIAQNQATQRAEEARLGYTRIYAPIGGTVVSVAAREGQTLNATYQTPIIMRIADLSTMTVWAEVSEADVRQVKAGLPARFTTLGTGDDIPRRWEGAVRQVLPAPLAATTATTDNAAAQAGGGGKAVSYTVLFDIENSDGALMPQMTAQVSFITAQADQVLAVPLTALQREGEGLQVRVLQDTGRVVGRPVKLGVRSRHLAQIQEGLAEGEQVVLKENVDEKGWSWLQW